MIINEQTFILKNESRLILRSPEIEDAGVLLAHNKLTSTETYFLARYPEECNADEASMIELINRFNQHPFHFMICAFIDDELVGTAGFQRIKNHIKYMHRASFGISIQQRACNQGIGEIMIKQILSIAQDTDIEQIELAVFEDNHRAIHLYKKMGFEITGSHPRAYKLKDGTYRDEIQMIYYIK